MFDIDKIDIMFHIFFQLYRVRIVHFKMKLNSHSNHFKSFCIHTKLALLERRKNRYLKQNYETNLLDNRDGVHNG